MSIKPVLFSYIHTLHINLTRWTAVLVALSLTSCTNSVPPIVDADLTSGESFHDPFIGKGQGPEMVVIPSGTLMMGISVYEKYGRGSRARPFEFTNEFAVGKYEVTWEQWEACIADKGCDGSGPESLRGDNGWGRGHLPMIEVTWDDAKAYTLWLSKKTGKPYRLLSDAEWEYAARAGTETSFFWGEDEDLGCPYRNASSTRARESETGWSDVFSCEDGYENTAPIGSFKPNAFGLYDMIGNVTEWVEDCSGSFPLPDGSAVKVEDCKKRKLRGGGFSSDPRSFHLSKSGGAFADSRYNNLGFRVARMIDRPNN